MRIRGRVNELSSNADLIALALQRPFEHVADIERLTNLAHVDRLVLVSGGRVAGDDIEITEVGEVGDDVLGQAIGDPTGRLVAAQIVERQDGDASAGHGRLLGGPESPDAAGEDHGKEHGRGGKRPA
jgi:hypothetical protein